MVLLVIILLCLVLISNLYTPSPTQQIQSQPLHGHQRATELRHLLDLELPRKLRISQELDAKEHLDEASSSVTDKKEDSPGKQKQNGMHASRGTSQDGEWADPLKHFTMDYTSIRRRRPIHNMSFQHP